MVIQGHILIMPENNMTKMIPKGMLMDRIVCVCEQKSGPNQ